MFEKLKWLYLEAKLSEAQLDMAVGKGWITEIQKDEILSAKEV